MPDNFTTQDKTSIQMQAKRPPLLSPWLSTPMEMGISEKGQELARLEMYDRALTLKKIREGGVRV